VLFDLLHGALGASAATLVCEAEIVSLDSQPDLVTAIDAAGRRHGPFDLLLVCDGAHSSLRGRYAALRADPLYPWGCVWACLPDPERRFAGWLHQRFHGTTMMAGVLPVGHDPAHPQAASAVTLFWSLPGAAMEAWPRSDFAAWRRHLAGLWPALAPLLDRLNGPDDFTQARYRDVGLRRWRQGRVLFLGDACHGTSPQLGQGANLALLDAWSLAHALDQAGEGDVEAALDRVERRRRRQVDFYRQASRWLTPFYQSRLAPLGWLRDLAFGPACRFGPTRRMMLTTLAGLRCSWLASHPFDAATGFDPDAD
jgi:2-polyprenyl-6-methoxyphenol hydroxylase-like FAD-dependent oxidoreductase